MAVLIDAENVSGDFASHVLREAGAYGATVTRRAYGDFAQGRGSGWLAVAPAHAVDTIQVSSPCNSKNFSDMRMTIDAVELMFANKADVFCLVSSDGDFTPLAIHLRGAGKVVVGIGAKQASTTFRQSCDFFHIVGRPAAVPVPVAATPKPQAKLEQKPAKPQALLPLLSKVFKTLVANADYGWVSLPSLAAALREVDPDFTVKSYGSATLKKALLREPSLELQEREKGMFVRVKRGIAVISA
ncbi:NYN domain-containing protein [Pararhizobium sp. LjRoot235]|uniref:NYN domain-containing protein n=1 Tax=Pararhizobium sp. LjRoot235 TaxID=3342291 RepID=UPI003ED171DF